MSLISLPLSLLIIFFASSFGIWAVAASSFLILPLQALTAFCFVSRHISVRVADMGRATLKSGIVTIMTLGGIVGAGLALNDLSLSFSSIRFLIEGILCGGGNKHSTR